MKKVFISLLLLGSFFYASGQNEINKIDERGLRQGRWIIQTVNSQVECGYLDNLLHGVYLSHSAVSGKLQSIGEFDHGEYSGTWYFFDDNGTPLSKVENIQKNDSIVINSKKIYFKGGKPEFVATLVNFYNSGMIKSKGTILYSGSFEEDYLEYGEWIVYDTKGNVIRTVDKSNDH